MSWGIDEERAHVEGILCQRFNFLLVFVSLVIAGAVAANDSDLSTALFTFGAIVCIPLALTIGRAQRRLNYMMEQLVYADAGHVAKKVHDVLCESRGIPSMRNWIGYWIPLLCCLVLLGGAIAAQLGLLFHGSGAPKMPATATLTTWIASDLPTWITAGAAAASVLLIWLAYRTLKFEAWLKAQGLFTEDQFTEARGRVFAKESPIPVGDLKTDPALKSAAGLVCRRLDELAHLFDMKVVDTRRARASWDIHFAKSLIALEPFIEHRRTTDHDPDLWRELVSVAEAALRRVIRRSNRPPWDLTSNANSLGPRTRAVLEGTAHSR